MICFQVGAPTVVRTLFPKSFAVTEMVYIEVCRVVEVYLTPLIFLMPDCGSV